MDVVQDWAAYLLNDVDLSHAPYLYRLYSVAGTAKSWLLPLIDQVSQKPDLATIALLLIIVLVSLKILDMLWKTLLFWMRFVRRLVLWGGIAALGLWFWSRGPDGVLEDVQYWQGQWSHEYGYWKEEERVARLARQGGFKHPPSIFARQLTKHTHRLRIWQTESSAGQKMASSESSSEAPSGYSAPKRNRLSARPQVPPSDSSSEAPSEYSALKRNRPSTRPQVPPSDSSSEAPFECSAPKRNRQSTRQQAPPSESNSEQLSEQSSGGQMCSEHEQEAVELEWMSAKSFQELLDLNRKFLRCESKRSCYHRGPIFNETIALVPGLLRLHDYGMLTVESQPSQDTAPTWENCPCCPFEGWFQNQQRPYLIFILPYHDKIPKKAVRRFLVELLIDDDFYAHVWRDGGSCRWGNCRKDVRTASSFPQDWTTNIRKQAKEKDGVASATPFPAQRLDLQCGCQADVFRTHEKVMEKTSPLLVRVLAKSWEETDLQALVENAAIRAGVQPLYTEASEEQ
ncbi:hypothetical protein D0859_12442 [Hortaea werneckii]|uniref:Uncharacterized protein n=2 Tax=Hortaea werneckii TaxID=91943 RepID=A0A3M7ID39_HORWE|nr:hypothetical protein D0859_12442 [Hortaea werneckii]